MIIATTKYLDFKSTKISDNSEWFYVKRTNDSIHHDSAVCITTVVKIEGKYYFLFLKTNRPPISAENKAKYCIESPAGLIGDENNNETLLECIKKELLEETGLVADKIFIEINNASTSSGLSSETLTYATVFVNDNSVKQEPISDNGIIVDRFYVGIDEVHSYFLDIDKNKYSIASATVCGVFFALKRL